MAIKKQGRKQIDLPNVTNAQRASYEEKGTFIFNTNKNLAEYYDGTQWKTLDSGPVITSVSSSTLNATDISGGTTLTITGANFSSVTVKIIDQAATEVTATVNSQSSTQIVIAVPTNLTYAQEPFDIKVENSSGLTATLEDAFNVNEAPVITTSAGSLGSITLGDTHTSLTTSTIAATDDEGNSITFAVASGALPGGFSLNTSTGAITGTSTASGTFNFTITATDGTNTSAGTAYSITVTAPPFMTATGGSIANDGDYKVHTFTSSGTFTVTQVGSDSTYGNKVEYLSVAGGGGGGGNHGGGGGGGGYRHNSAYNYTVTAQGYTVTVGGNGGLNSNGGNSAFATITSSGGGRGGNDNAGGSGGSGGGGASYPSSYSGGSGNSGGHSPSEGNNGGSGQSGNKYGAGGGGGAGATGQNGSSSQGGQGGSGSQNDITGTNTYYSPGGGGHHHGGGGNGGTGGGGNHDNTGGGSAKGSGGGGNGHGGGVNSADGIVIVRYKFQ